MKLPPTDVIVTAKRPRKRGFIRWKPRTETRILLDAIQNVLIEYDEILPVTIRQVYYRLIALGVIEDKSLKASKRLEEMIQKARRAGIIFFEAIRDDGVIRSHVSGYHSEVHVRDMLRHIVRTAKINPGPRQPLNLMVVCEAAGMVPQLERIADPYGVPVISGGGFMSLSTRHEIVTEIDEDGRPALIFHIGDYDPSGLHIYQSMAEDIAALADGDVSFRRLAVTPEQIEQHRLPTAPKKATDARTFDGTGTVQAEALPPNVLARLLRDSLDEFTDPVITAMAEKDTEAMRLRLQSVLKED